MDIAKIEWIDSCHFSGWRQEHEYRDTQISRCVSVGFLIRKTKTEIVFAQSYSDTGNYAEITAIPIQAIKKITILERRK